MLKIGDKHFTVDIKEFNVKTAIMISNLNSQKNIDTIFQEVLEKIAEAALNGSYVINVSTIFHSLKSKTTDEILRKLVQKGFSYYLVGNMVHVTWEEKE